MSLCIVIPMKNPQHSKQRLGSVLAPVERQCLALNLFHSTLAFLSQHFNAADVLIVTPSEFIAGIAGQYQMNALVEPSAKGLNAAINQGAIHCQSKGYDSVLILPADIIELDITEFKLLVEALDTQKTELSVVISPADDGGTNALICSPPTAIDFCYGENSSQKHWQQAQSKGLNCKLLALPKLALDLDTPADLAQLNDSEITQLKLANHASQQQPENPMRARAFG